jgi:anti-sigma B factor antagonist
MMTDHRMAGDVHVVKPAMKQLNSTVSAAFRSEVLTKVQDDSGSVVVNLEDVEFIDSSGVGALVAILKSLDGNRTLVLCCPHEPVRSLLELTRMDKIFRVYDSEEDAIGSFATASP